MVAEPRETAGANFAGNQMQQGPEKSAKRNSSAAKADARQAVNVGAKAPTPELSDGDVGAQINVLNRVQQLYAFAHRTLKGLAPGD
jgi:hypothetical protein